MRLPELSPLQFLVSYLLFDGRRDAAELREQLDRRGLCASPDAFSKLMKRMGRLGYVNTEIVVRMSEGRPIRERRCTLTDLGLVVWRATRDFYAGFPHPPDDVEVVHTDLAQFVSAPPNKRRELSTKQLGYQLTEAFFHTANAPQEYFDELREMKEADMQVE